MRSVVTKVTSLSITIRHLNYLVVLYYLLGTTFLEVIEEDINIMMYFILIIGRNGKQDHQHKAAESRERLRNLRMARWC